MKRDPTQACVVLGALGFLGRRVATEFSEAGYRVLGVGREGVPHDGGLSLGLADYQSIDLPGPRFADLLYAERPDVIVNAAGPASVGDSMTRPHDDFLNSAAMLSWLLVGVREHSPAARVVLLSSAAVYGDPDSLPISEDAPIRPVSPYGFDKRMCEVLLREYWVVYGVRSCALRVFSAYGEGLRRQILWDVCEKATSGLPVRLFGTGSESRDFIHARDVARAVRVAAERAPMEAEVYNVASGVEATIRAVAETIVARVAPGTPIEFSGVGRAGDPSRWRADVSKLARLGFETRVPFLSGVEEYCSWYLAQGGAT